MTTETLNFATPIAPEDIQAGIYVAPMNDTHQFPLRACEGEWTPGGVPKVHVVSVRMTSFYPHVYRVLGVAVPFVLVEDSDGDQTLISVRRIELARLPEELGRRAMRELDRRRRGEARERRKNAQERAAARDAPGAGACGAD